MRCVNEGTSGGVDLVLFPMLNEGDFALPFEPYNTTLAAAAF